MRTIERPAVGGHELAAEGTEGTAASATARMRIIGLLDFWIGSNGRWQMADGGWQMADGLES